MYVIAIPKEKEFKRCNGKPFRQVKLDEDGLGIKVMEDGKPKVRKGSNGEDIYEFETEVAGYLATLGLGLDNIMDVVAVLAKENKEIKKMTTEDSANIYDIWRAIHVVHNGKLELEKHPYEWLLKTLEAFGADIYGVNAAVMLEPVKKAEEIAPNRAERKRTEKEE